MPGTRRSGTRPRSGTRSAPATGRTSLRYGACSTPSASTTTSTTASCGASTTTRTRCGSSNQRAAGASRRWGAGGRYDGLIELLGGPPTPGTGFATGIERIVLNLGEQGVEGPCPAAVDVVTVPVGEEGAAWAMHVARELRRAGLVVRGGTTGRSLRAQLRAAGRLGARYAVIAGEREAADRVVQLKPLAASGEERTLDMEGLIGALARGSGEAGSGDA